MHKTQSNEFIQMREKIAQLLSGYKGFKISLQCIRGIYLPDVIVPTIEDLMPIILKNKEWVNFKNTSSKVGYFACCIDKNGLPHIGWSICDPADFKKSVKTDCIISKYIALTTALDMLGQQAYEVPKKLSLNFNVIRMRNKFFRKDGGLKSSRAEGVLLTEKGRGGYIFPCVTIEEQFIYFLKSIDRKFFKGEQKNETVSK